MVAMKEMILYSPNTLFTKWQELLNLLAEAGGIPAALIMKLEEDFLEVFVSSNSDNNPYKVGAKEHSYGLYCETVIKTNKKLLVPNALTDPNWDNNPDIKLGMISYLGYPINFPDNKPFGTICILDTKENHFSLKHENLLLYIKNVIESDLSLLHSNENLRKTNQEYKKINEELFEAREKYRLLAENISDVIWVLNLTQNKMTYVSPSCIHLTGFTVEEAMQLSIDNSIENDSAEKVKQMIPELINEILQNPKEIKYKTIEVRQKCKDGNFIWVENTLHLQLAANGDIEVMGVSRNIENRKKLEFEILDKNKKLVELNTMKDKFFSIIAHDLHNPFAGIRGISEIMETTLLEEDLKNSSQLLQITKMIRETSNSALELLTNIVEWAKSQTGEINVSPINLSMESIFSSAYEVVRGNALKKNITIEKRFSENDTVYADNMLVNIILRNLLTNAIKFTQTNGKIIVSAEQKDTFFEISVIDSGVGIDPNNFKKIFRIDSKFSLPGTEKEKGSGLGLILCKEFVEKQGGKIWVESKLGKGSKFIFTLPRGKV